MKDVFATYVEMIVHFHLRWTYAQVLTEMLDEKMSELGLPSAQRANLFGLMRSEGELESNKWLAETKALAERLAAISLDKGTVDARFERDILSYSSSYRMLDIDDLSAAPSVSMARKYLQTGAGQSFCRRTDGVGNVQFHLSPRILLDSDFWRLLALNALYARIKDDAHHLQPRGQFMLRDALVELGARLTEMGMLTEPDQIIRSLTGGDHRCGGGG